MKNIILSIFIISLFFSCDTNNVGENSFNYPDSKTWKHGVYSKYDAQKYEGVFDGLEVDIIYSPKKNDIYVGRVEADTSKNQTLEDWFSILEKANSMSYWIDFKNLSADNAEDAYAVLDNIVNKYNLHNKFMVESKDLKALMMAKERGYHVILWVENLHYWKKKTRRDTISVMKKIRNQIDDLHPDAISCEYTMFPLLCDSFPEQNIHFWDTPKKYTPENVEFTKKLCENESVKVVLVDYPNPID
ncbi:MAG: hypothetical protein IKY27_09220 [Bacteroidales bacterium]|nr:hypothetical protein [Bacteroidales bacterium]